MCGNQWQTVIRATRSHDFVPTLIKYSIRERGGPRLVSPPSSSACPLCANSTLPPASNLPAYVSLSHIQREISSTYRYLPVPISFPPMGTPHRIQVRAVLFTPPNLQRCRIKNIFLCYTTTSGGLCGWVEWGSKEGGRNKHSADLRKWEEQRRAA